MACEDHIKIFEAGSDAWNTWRLADLNTWADLSNIDFGIEYADIEDFRLFNFYKTNLQGCSFNDADFRKCVFRKSDLSGAQFRLCDFSGANLQEAQLSGALILGCSFEAADLRHAKLNSVSFGHSLRSGGEPGPSILVPVSFKAAKIISATFEHSVIHEDDFIEEAVDATKLMNADYEDAGSDLERQAAVDAEYSEVTTVDLDNSVHHDDGKLLLLDFRDADLTAANFQSCVLSDASRYSDFSRAILIGSDFTRAEVSYCNFWETRRSKWKIVDIHCEAAFFDEAAEEEIKFNPGEFERLYGERQKIKIHYNGGVSPVDLALMPIALFRLQEEHPGSRLYLSALEESGSGATVSINVEFDTLVTDQREQEQEIEALKKDLILIRERLDSEKDLRRVFETRYQTLSNDVLPLLLDRVSPRGTVVNIGKLDGTFTLEERVGDDIKIYGQAGAVGSNARADNATLQQYQAGVPVNELVDQLARLAKEMEQADLPFSRVTAIQSAEKAAAANDLPAVNGFLKSAGKEALGVAEKIGIPVVIELMKNALT